MKWLLLLICSMVCITVPAQQLNFRSFSFAQGLNTYNIQKVIQDNYGFLWIATQDGVYRYNGKTFEAFRKGNPGAGALRENFILDLHYAHNNQLYVACFNGGIDVIDVRTLAVRPLVFEKTAGRDGVPNLWIKKLYCDEQDNLWIGGKDFFSLYNLHTKKYTHFNQLPGLSGAPNITFIKALDSSTIAVGAEDFGILLFDQKSRRLTGQITELTPGEITGSKQISDLLMVGKDVYLSTTAGIIKGKLHNNRWTFQELISSKEADRKSVV